MSSKLQCSISQYTDDLDLSAYIDPDPGGMASNNACLYELLSVGAHQGENMSTGHYVYYGRVPSANNLESSWVLMDDTDSGHRDGQLLPAKANGLIPDRSNGLVDVGTEVCLFLYRLKSAEQRAANFAQALFCKPSDVPDLLSWNDLHDCQVAANMHGDGENAFQHHVALVAFKQNQRNQAIRDAAALLREGAAAGGAAAEIAGASYPVTGPAG
jgi:hypothetical protein